MTLSQFSCSIFKPYKYYILLMFLTGIFWGIYISLSPYLLKLIIDNLVTASSTTTLYRLAGLYVLLYFLTAMNFRLLEWVKYKILPPIKKNIAMQMFSYIKNHSHAYFQNNFAGALSNKVNDMVVNLESLLNASDEFFAIGLSFLIAIFVMYTVNPWFSIALTTWCVLYLTISMIYSKKINQLSIKTSAAYSKYSGTLVDILANMASVRLFSNFKHETHQLNQRVDDLVVKDKYMLKYILKLRLIQDATLVTVLGLNFIILLTLYQQGKVTVGDFALILSITMSIFQFMWQLASKIIDVYKCLGKCHQAMSLLQHSHDVVDVKGAKPLQVTSGHIAFKNVNFSYHDGQPVFIDKNINIKPGTKVGLVGFSGSGKSTFINLILRFYNLDEGEILIDGQNIALVQQNALREKISMIPQDISLFHRTLMDNIRYGNIHASDEDVIAASKKAHCHEFISKLPQGYQTMVGERGVKLSGGQRQRIAIARAFLEDAPILILDEATSSLDTVTEKYIQESLNLAIQNRTTLVIAHRLSTLLEMDCILVFDQGRIIESGNHAALLRENGHYAKMWDLQSNGFLPTSQ